MRSGLFAAGAAACAVLIPCTASSETIRIVMDKMAVTPATISARVGDTVEWVNDDFLAHTATARNKDWDVALAPKTSGRITLRHPGEIDYFCRYHPTMTGRISVAPR